MTLQDIVRNFRKINLPEGGEETQIDIAYRLYNNAILLIKAGRNNEARRDLKEAVRRYPRFDDAYMLLGLTHFACGNRIDSIKTINMISDPKRHSDAMRYYDALASDEDVAIEGEFSEAGGETDAERRRRQLEREYSYGRQVGSRQDGRDYGDRDEAVSDTVFGQEEERREKPLSDFEKRFRAAQKSVSGVDAFDVELKGSGSANRPRENVEKRENRGNSELAEKREKREAKKPSEPRVTPAGSASSVAFGDREDVFDDSANEGDAGDAGTAGISRETDENAAENPARIDSISFDNDEFDTEIIPTPARQGRSENRTGIAAGSAPAYPEASESARETEGSDAPRQPSSSFEERVAAAKKSGRSRGSSDTPDTPPQSGFAGKKTAVMAIIVAACILVTAAVAAVALKLHLGHINKTSPSGSPEPESTATEFSPTEDPDATPGPGETEGPTTGPGETEAPSEEPTAAPTGEPTPTPQGKTEAELKAEASQKLSELKSLYSSRSYYECVEQINAYDWSHLDNSLKAEKDKLAGDALAAFSNEYYNLMYSNVGKEDWNAVLAYALPLIKYNPDYERGAPVYFSAGKAYDFLGDKENAEKYYRETMARYPGTNDAEYARYRLSLLTG